MKAYLGFRAATSSDLEAIRDWLAAEAMVQDRPVVLFQLACGRLFQLGLVRPGLTVIEESLVGAAREAARVETARRVAPLLTDERCRMLDELLVVDAGLGIARATWLRLFPVQASPAAMHAELDKLTFLRDLGVGDWDLSALPGKRVSTLAGWTQTASNQALAQSSPQRRYPALLAFASERLFGVTDGLVDLFDKLLADTNAKAAAGWASTSCRSPAPPTTRWCCSLTSSGCCSTRTSDGSRLATLFEAVPKDRLAAALAECDRIARPVDAPTSTCWGATTPGCASASLAGWNCSPFGPTATATSCSKASRCSVS